MKLLTALQLIASTVIPVYAFWASDHGGFSQPELTILLLIVEVLLLGQLRISSEQQKILEMLTVKEKVKDEPFF